MRTSNREAEPGARLTSEEIDSLRARFRDIDGNLPDLTANGATTLSDIAEAVGMSPAAVQTQLDEIRKQKAFESGTDKKPNQLWMVSLAAILFGSAYAIYRFTPHKLSEAEIDARISEANAAREAKFRERPIVHYPIVSVVRTGPNPPLGLQISFRGMLTETTTSAIKTVSPLKLTTASSATKELLAAVEEMYKVAVEAEMKAPTPTKPLPVPSVAGSLPINPRVLAFAITTSGGGGLTGFMNLPKDGQSLTPPDVIERTVTSYIASLEKLQHDLSNPAMSEFDKKFVRGPAGIGITVSGTRIVSARQTPLFFTPIDAGKCRSKLSWALRELVRQSKQPFEYFSPQQRAEFSKKATPAFFNVSIIGPYETLDFKIPQTASEQYPSAAQAMEAADKIIDEQIDKAMQQIVRANKEFR